MEKNIVPFGAMPDGTIVEKITLRSGSLSCGIITYGAALQSLIVPDSAGKPVDVALGFDTLDAYRRQKNYLGAIIGRYANRISGARFSLNGKEYPLAANDGGSHLHGGNVGFDKQVWTVDSQAENAVALSLFSSDGQEGYPGNLSVKVVYRLSDNALSLDYWAQSDRDTPCNLTNHAYFNLSGHASGPIDGHFIQIPAEFYTPIADGLIPTGKVAPVAGTPLDLRKERIIGRLIDANHPQIKLAGGYDHNWIVAGEAGTLRLCARARSPRTGIAMETLTTLPGVQFYTGNYLGGCPTGKGGAKYENRGGFCLETQYFPDAVHCAAFPSVVLRAGDIYKSRTIYRFSAAQ